ncbi:hypothetical protein GCM10009107_17900 [Ideonella azotifigens]|uniref:Diguanylate cyclase n=2 Tax=Ideonella azotifigens TaxID=513160 RepID=A0ABN1JX48_9BURK
MTAAIGAAVGLLMLLGIRTVFNNSVTRAEEARSQARERYLELGLSLGAMLDAETGQRGYVLTALPSFLAPYQGAHQRANESLQRLRPMYAEDAEGLASLDELQRWELLKFNELQEIIDVRRESGLSAARERVADERGQHDMEQIRRIIDALRERESGAQATLAQVVQQARRDETWFELLFVALLLGAGGLVYRSQLQRAHEAQEAATAQVASERRLRAVTDNIPAMVVRLDREARILFANPAAGMLLGETQESMLGRTVREVRGEASYQAMKPYIERVLAGESVVFETSPVIAGVQRHFQQHYAPDRDEAGLIRGYFVFMFDITERKLAEQRQAQSERQLRTITDNLPVQITYIKPDETVAFANATLQHWMDVPVKDILGKPLNQLLGPTLYAERSQPLQRCLRGERVEFESQSEVHGAGVWLHTTYLPDVAEDGSVVGVYALSSDISALKAVQQELNAQARVDTLTGLPNRRQFDERLPQALARSRRSRRPLALLFLDVDHFKQVNDTHGHPAGDAVLAELARRLLQVVRATDTVARLAGDEFVAILENLHHPDDAHLVAEKIVEAIRRPMLHGDLSVQVSASVGVSFYDGPHDTMESLVARADQALYRAKAAGRNTFAVTAA